MCQTEIISLQILPHPVHSGKLTEVWIEIRDIISCAIPLIAYRILALSSNMKRNVYIILWHTIFLVCSNDDFDV